MFRSARVRPRTVLLAAVLLILGSIGMHLVAPWILPVRIIEGPLVQQATEDSAIIIWYTTRPVGEGACELVLSDEAGERVFAAEADGARNRVYIADLAPGRAYEYSVRLDGRVLTDVADPPTLHTNKPAGEPFSFVVFGDSGRGTIAQYQIGGLMFSAQPDFALHTGDLVYSSGERSKYNDRFFTPYRLLLASVSFWPSLGNHDLRDFSINPSNDEQPYLEVFELPENGPAGLPPERNYWFDYAAARVVVIDSNTDDETLLAERVAPWVQEVLADCDAEWKFVCFHHPPYTAGKYKPNVVVQRALVPTFEAVGVDIVFNGHDHMYERTYPLLGGEVAADGEGVVYIVTGAGGARLYDALPADERPGYIAALYNERHSFTHVYINGPDLRLQQIDVEGNLVDEWSMSRRPRPTPTPTSQPEGAP